MIIWKGYGFLVLIIALAIGALFSFVFSAIGFGEDLGAAVGALISSIVIWFVGLKFNTPQQTRTFIDKKTGQEVVMRPDHSFFFIKMQYWAFIVGSIGLIMLIGVLVKGKSPF
jgi:hypothetical protein